MSTLDLFGIPKLENLKMLGIEDSHKPVYAGLIILTFAGYVAHAILICFSLEQNPDQEEFYFDVNDTIDDYIHIPLNPAAWTHYTVWAMILLWQFMWLCYGVSTIFRFTSYGYLYIAPGHMTPGIYISIIFGFILSTLWMSLLGNGYPETIIAWIWLASVALFIGLGISLYKLFKRGAVLEREEADQEIWCVRLLVQNGLQIFAFWCMYLAIVNTNLTFVYMEHMAPPTSSTVVLSFLLTFLVIYSCVDLLVMDRYSRYIIGGYIVIILSLAGTMDELPEAESSTWTLTINNLVAVSIAFVLKIILLFYRHVNVPVWTGNTFFVSARRGYGALDLYRDPYESYKKSLDTSQEGAF